MLGVKEHSRKRNSEALTWWWSACSFPHGWNTDEKKRQTQTPKKEKRCNRDEKGGDRTRGRTFQTNEQVWWGWVTSADFLSTVRGNAAHWSERWVHLQGKQVSRQPARGSAWANSQDQLGGGGEPVREREWSPPFATRLWAWQERNGGRR